MFGRATITLGNGPHFELLLVYGSLVKATQQFGDEVRYIARYVGESAVSTVDDRVRARAARWTSGRRRAVVVVVSTSLARRHICHITRARCT